MGEGATPPAEEVMLPVPESVEPLDSDDEAPEEVGFQQSKKVEFMREACDSGSRLNEHHVSAAVS